MTHRLDDVLALIKKLNGKEFYGNITIKFHQGRVVHIVQEEVISRTNGDNPDTNTK